MITPTQKIWRYISVFVFTFVFAYSAAFGQISVTATAGTTGPTVYTTLGAAFTAINAGTHQGVINISVTANTTETAMCQLNASGTGSASYSSVLIKPSIGATPVISGAVANFPVIALLGSSITIDGSNTVGGTTRNLTVKNTSTTNPNVVGIFSSGTAPAHDITVANCILQNGSVTSTYAWAVVFDDVANVGLGGYFNNVNVQNNSIRKTSYGITVVGVAGSGTGSNVNITGNDLNSTGANTIDQVGIYTQDVNLNGGGISSNNIGNFSSSSAGQKSAIWLATNTSNVTVASNNISGVNATDDFITTTFALGILVTPGVTTSNITVSGNTIAGVSSDGTGASSGIYIGGATGGVSLNSNNISNIKNTNTLGYGSNGIRLTSTLTSAAITVYNNFIFDVASYGYTPFIGSIVLDDDGYGIAAASGGGYGIYHNTVDLTTDQTTGITAAMFINGVTTAASMDIRDNIFANNQTSNTRYSIYCVNANTIFSNINYNDYYSAGTLGRIGGTNRTTLAQIQTGFGGNLNSITPYNPAFTSTTDLHLTTAAANNVLAAGTPISSPSITTDIDGNGRSTTAPTIGADEIVSNNITYTALTNTCSNGDVALNGVTITSGVGVPTTGTTVPQIYFKKGVAGTWYHASGTLASGTGTSGTWNFTITAATMGGVVGGDVIYYYVIAQTTGATVFASPSTGLVATDVNTVTTAPTTPNSYTVNAVSLTGLALMQSACYSPVTATSATFAYTGSAGTPNQYTLTWSPAGPTNVSAFTALPASPISVSIPGGTAANTYTGTLTIKNSTTGCTNTYTLTLTINAAPVISGVLPLCPGGSAMTLTGTPTGGSWSGGTAGTATISAGGVVTSGASGTAIVTYTALTTACTDTALVTVITAPAAITGSTTVCIGGVITLNETTSGGTWSSSLISRATVDATSGAVYGVSAGAVTISYIMPSGCYVTYAMTVGAAPAPITGLSSVCIGDQITLSHPVSTGTWVSAPTAIATITTGGVVGGAGAGTAHITYTLSPGCIAYKDVTVNALPAAITVPSGVCAAGGTITLTDASAPGTWSTTGSTSIATLTTSTGMVTGVSAGSITVTFTETATGCRTTAPVVVNALPAPISGATTTVCSGGATIVLTDVSGPGVWSNSTTGAATVNASTGIVYGVTAGTETITFTQSSTSCYRTQVVTVIPIPSAIVGSGSVCASGGVTTLTDATTPGTWSISTGPAATITASGVVTGINAGSATVTYTAANSCYVTIPITVNALPSAITGTFAVCQASVTTLSSLPATGTWSVGSAAIATVVGGGGFRGVSPGTTTVTYTLPTTCRVTASLTVNEIPATIEGATAVCLNGITTLSNSVSGGTWSSSTLSVATVEATTGIVHGVAVGATTISYTTGTNGCYALLPMSVTTIVTPTVALNVNPGTTVCEDTLVTYTPTIVNGGAAPLYVWSVNNVILSGTPTYSYHPHDGDIVRLWILSSYDCASPDTASAWVSMTVHPIVTPALSLSTGMGDTVCNTTLTTLYPIPVNGGTAPIYQWTVNGVPSGVSASYTYAPSNGDVINCVMTSNAFCRTANTAASSKVLTVSPLITPAVNINSLSGYTICEGYPDVMTTSMYGGGTAPTYQWAVNGTNAGTGAGFTYTPVNGDVVTVTMTSNFPCVTTPTATSNIALTVLPITQPVGVISAQPGYIIPAGVNDTFTCTIVSGGGVAPTYQWYINNVPQPGATSSVFIAAFLHSGDSVNCEVVNTDQCSGVSVFSYLHITVGENVGIHDLSGQGSNVLLLPNPTTGSFRVKGNVAGMVSGMIDVQVTDMLGKAVYMGKAGVQNGVVDQELTLGDNLTNGTYLLTIRNGEEQHTMHFTLQR